MPTDDFAKRLEAALLPMVGNMIRVDPVTKRVTALGWHGIASTIRAAMPDVDCSAVSDGVSFKTGKLVADIDVTNGEFTLTWQDNAQDHRRKDGGNAD